MPDQSGTALPLDRGCQVGPHEFRPLKKWRNRGRCEACYVHENVHPVTGWTPSRHYGDKSMPGSLRAILGGAQCNASSPEAERCVLPIGHGGSHIPEKGRGWAFG